MMWRLLYADTTGPCPLFVDFILKNCQAKGSNKIKYNQSYKWMIFYAYMRMPANERKKINGCSLHFLQSLCYRLCLGIYMEFFINMPYMGTYGADADKIFFTQFFITQALYQ